jgi:CRP-like cAMP-binding protein
MTAVSINSGKTIVREGDVGREFMIILSGTASVSRQGNKFATLGPGDFFGEMSLLGKGPRSATVTAETELLVEALNRREFATMLHKNPEIAEKILADAHGRSTQEASMSEAV